jgi:Fe2+ transport system protein FeoA
MLNLTQLADGALARVVAVTQPGETGERLMELGLTPGVLVSVIRRGLFGDPLQLSVRGAMLSMRRAEAESVQVAALA